MFDNLIVINASSCILIMVSSHTLSMVSNFMSLLTPDSTYNCSILLHLPPGLNSIVVKMMMKIVTMDNP